MANGKSIGLFVSSVHRLKRYNSLGYCQGGHYACLAVPRYRAARLGSRRTESLLIFLMVARSIKTLTSVPAMQLDASTHIVRSCDIYLDSKLSCHTCYINVVTTHDPSHSFHQSSSDHHLNSSRLNGYRSGLGLKHKPFRTYRLAYRTECGLSVIFECASGARFTISM